MLHGNCTAGRLGTDQPESLQALQNDRSWSFDVNVELQFLFCCVFLLCLFVLAIAVLSRLVLLYGPCGHSFLFLGVRLAEQAVRFLHMWKVYTFYCQSVRVSS